MERVLARPHRFKCQAYCSVFQSLSFTSVKWEPLHTPHRFLRMSQVCKSHVYSTVYPFVFHRKQCKFTHLLWLIPNSKLHLQRFKNVKGVPQNYFAKFMKCSLEDSQSIYVCRCVWYKGSITVFKASSTCTEHFPKMYLNNGILFCTISINI